MEANNFKPFKHSQIKKWSKQILQGLKIIHKRGYVHSDLKPENIMMTCNDKGEPDDAKIADFGLTSKIGIPYEPDGTINYMSPEELNLFNDIYYDPAMDMWAFGCIVYELANGHPPFDSGNQREIVNNINIVKRNESDYITLTKTPFLLDFINHLLVKDTNIRMTAEQALIHPWITEEVGVKPDPDLYIEINIRNNERLDREEKRK